MNAEAPDVGSMNEACPQKKLEIAPSGTPTRSISKSALGCPSCLRPPATAIAYGAHSHEHVVNKVEAIQGTFLGSMAICRLRASRSSSCPKRIAAVVGYMSSTNFRQTSAILKISLN